MGHRNQEKTPVSNGFLLDDSGRFGNFSAVCSLCKHFDVSSASDGKKTCKAFPQAIPKQIWSGLNPHIVPYPGDNGIQFEAFNA